MRGTDKRSGELFSYVDLEQRVRADHPLRAIRSVVNEALGVLSDELTALYSGTGRPSIAPEMLLRAMLLRAFYSVRSERQLMERLEFDLLFRWFVGLGVDEPVWDHSTFSKNRDRLLNGDVAARFLSAILAQPRVRRLAALEMIEPHADRPRAITLGADRGYDTADFVEELRTLNIRPHVAQNISRRRSAIDRRTTRHPGYAASLRARKRIEEAFGWIKTVAGLRRTKLRGRDKVDWSSTFAAAAYNLIRLALLGPANV